MNQSILMGRLTRDPEIRYSRNENATAIANMRLAVDRRFRKNEDEPSADFFSCTAFGKLAEFAEQYLRQGIKVVVTGELRNDNYTNKDGSQVYGTRIILSSIEFAESKKNNPDQENSSDTDRERGRQRGNASGNARREENSQSRNKNAGGRSAGSGRSSGNRSAGRRSGDDGAYGSGSGQRPQNNRSADEEFMDTYEDDCVFN